MSTRSGKRIHASADSLIIDTDVTLRKERRTRSKQQKENIQVSVKKRHNYVSYPGDEDTVSVSSGAAETYEKVRRTRKSRKNTLKEQNLVPESDSLLLSIANKSVRKSRIGKKFIGRLEHVDDVIEMKNHENSESVTNDKKRIKNKVNHKNYSAEAAVIQEISRVTKTRGIKKKNGSNSIVNNQEANQINTGSGDTSDSFHSAADSPVSIRCVENDNQTKVPINFAGQDIADNIVSKTMLGVSIKKIRKSSFTDSMFETILTKDDGKQNLSSTFDISPELTITSNSTPEFTKKKKRKSNIKDSTFDKMDSRDPNETILDTTFDKRADTPTALNTKADISLKKRKRFINKSSTIDNIETNDSDEGILDRTFDKSTDASITLNTTINQSLRKRKRCTIKNSTCHNIKTNDLDEGNLNTTFDNRADTALNTKIHTSLRKRKRSTLKNCTIENTETNDLHKGNHNSTFDKTADTSSALNTIDVSLRKNNISVIKNSTIDNIEANDLGEGTFSTTFEKTVDVPNTVNNTTRKKIKSSIKKSIQIQNKVANNNSTINHKTSENSLANGNLMENNRKHNPPIKLAVLQDSDISNDTIHETNNKILKSSVINSTFDKIEKDLEDNEVKDTNGSFDKNYYALQISSINNKCFQLNNMISSSSEVKLSSTVERTSECKVKLNNHDLTFNKNDDIELNTSFDTENKSKMYLNLRKSSFINTESTVNVTLNKSEDNSCISITSDESETENILNHSPVLIESSINESLMSEDKTPAKLEAPITPLKREGTFTKEVSDIVMSPKFKESGEKTPDRRKSSPGCTPFPHSKSSQKENVKLNLTRSIEKSSRRSSLVETAPRQTRVMFCSPMNNPAVVSQVKGRVIKSNLKGSNKSFVFEDSVSSEVCAGRRKRSLTMGAGAEAETHAKRKRLADELQHSVDRLSRPRTQSAAAKLCEPGTLSKAKLEGKVSRTKLPNFAALHQKQFARMESLDECQQRRAHRARQLLTPTGSVGLVERISPKGTTPKPAAPANEPPAKSHTPSKQKLPTLDSLIPRYTRFGFRLNVDENPFGVAGTEARRRVQQTTCPALPSLAGAATGRREAAKRAVMREKSFSEKRDVKRSVTRTVIKGVRTNRRFELQMKMRNLNA